MELQRALTSTYFLTLKETDVQKLLASASYWALSDLFSKASITGWVLESGLLAGKYLLFAH